MTVTVTVTDPARVPDMERVFGSATVPVKGWLPEQASLPIGRRRVFIIDVDALTPGQRERLIAYGCERFGVARDEAEREIAEHGFPLLADSCIVVNDRPDFL